MDTEGREIELVLSLGEALHRYGAPSHRLEDQLTLVAQKLGLEARFFSTPTSIFAAFGPLSSERTCLVRVEPGEMDLEKLSDLDAIAIAVVDGALALDEARARVAEVVARAPRWSAPATIASFAASGGAAAAFLAGSARDVVAAAALGLLVGLVLVLASRTRALTRVAEPLAAAVASAASSVVAHFVAGTTPYVMLLASIIPLLPGLTLTTALRELAMKHLAAGTARLMGAVVTLLGLGFGVALGARVGDAFPPLPAEAASAWPWPAVAMAVVVAGLSFLVQLKANPRDAVWIVVFGALAYVGARASILVVGTELGAFGGAFLVAAASNVWARVYQRPATVTLVPALLLLVPGSVGFKSVTAMLDRQTLSAVDAAFTMAFVATSLVAGVLLANAAVPPRRPL